MIIKIFNCEIDTEQTAKEISTKLERLNYKLGTFGFNTIYVNTKDFEGDGYSLFFNKQEPNAKLLEVTKNIPTDHWYKTDEKSSEIIWKRKENYFQ